MLDEKSFAVLLSILPLSIIDSAIFPEETSLTFAFVVHKLPQVLFTILPLKQAFSVHLVLEPISFIDFSIGPDVSTVA